LSVPQTTLTLGEACGESEGRDRRLSRAGLTQALEKTQFDSRVEEATPVVIDARSAAGADVCLITNPRQTQRRVLVGNVTDANIKARLLIEVDGDPDVMK